MKTLRIILIQFLLLISTFNEVAAQSKPLKIWSTVNLVVPVSKKIEFKFTYLRALDFKQLDVDFNQNQMRIDYAFSKKLKLSVGGLSTASNSANAQDKKRLYICPEYTAILAKKVRWINGIQFETNSNSETRFKYRIQLQTRVGLKNRIKFLNLSPSIGYSLFYNLGGAPIQYFNEVGDKTVKQTPNGFHRGRLLINFNSKINNGFSLSFYYMAQQEFNFLTAPNRQMNVTNPKTGYIYRKFDNYHVIGISLAYELGRNNGNKPLLNF